MATKAYNPFPGLPAPADTDGRICFSLVFYDTEEKANAAAAHVVKTGATYNGGFFHGMACGRDKDFDRTPKDGPNAGKKLYAVTY